MVQIAWAIGWGLAVVMYTIIFSLVRPELAWRILFMLGILPALLILYVRKSVREPEVYAKTREAEEQETSEAVQRGARESSLLQILRSDLLGTTAEVSLPSCRAPVGY